MTNSMLSGAFLEGDVPVVAPVSGGGIFDYLWLIIALPALGAAVILLMGERRTHGWGHYLGTATVAGSFLLSLLAFVSLLGRDDAERSVGQHLYTWFEAGSFKAEAG